MRNNIDRILAQQAEILVDNTPKFVSAQNMLELPSRGIYYGENSSLFDKNLLEVKEMTTSDEDILTNSSYLKQGIALEKFLSSIILDKTVKVDDLLPCDFDYLLISARMSGYGPEYDARVTCPMCSKEQSVIIDTRTMLEVQTFPEIEGKLTENKTIKIVIPRNNVEVECKILTHGDIRYLNELKKQKIAANKPETNRTDQMKKIIMSVNGKNSKQDIEDFVMNSKPVDIRYILGVLDDYQILLNKNFDFQCSNEKCNHSQKMEVPVTAKFFWSF